MQFNYFRQIKNGNILDKTPSPVPSILNLTDDFYL